MSAPKAKLAAGVLTSIAMFAIPLFAPAGTLNWWRAWVIIGVVVAGTAGSLVRLSRLHSGVIEERSRGPFVPGQPLWDRVIVTFLLTTFVGVIVFSSYDVFHLQLLGKPGTFASSLGLALFIAGWWIDYLGIRENAFAAAVVRHQEDRHQTVIDTGIYGVIRHPIYLGGAMLIVGLPLWLESYAGAALAASPSAVMVVRLLFEERFLTRELPGYEAYTRRVRHRLIPHLW